jgi:hypothetical protein
VRTRRAGGELSRVAFARQPARHFREKRRAHICVSQKDIFPNRKSAAKSESMLAIAMKKRGCVRAASVRGNWIFSFGSFGRAAESAHIITKHRRSTCTRRNAAGDLC